MKLEKTLTIAEIHSTIISNAPYKIVLVDEHAPWPQKKSHLFLDDRSSSRWGITLSLNLVRRKLVLTIMDKRTLCDPYGQVIRIVSLSKKEDATPIPTTPPTPNCVVSRALKLSTPGIFDGQHALPCPFYQLHLQLTEVEYQECRVLPPESELSVNFALK